MNLNDYLDKLLPWDFSITIGDIPLPHAAAAGGRSGRCNWTAPRRPARWHRSLRDALNSLRGPSPIWTACPSWNPNRDRQAVRDGFPGEHKKKLAALGLTPPTKS
jgi:hypothetical protein